MIKSVYFLTKDIYFEADECLVLYSLVVFAITVHIYIVKDDVINVCQ